MIQGSQDSWQETKSRTSSFSGGQNGSYVKIGYLPTHFVR
jgi:hypothetical protein